MGKINIKRGAQQDYVNIRDFVPLASLDDLVFGGWDIFEDNVYEAASKAQVLTAGS
jgi:myo-inositol-1-phosphate synthase